MFNIRGILNRRNDPSRNSESLLSRTSDEGVENSASSAEGFLCPHCFLAFPTADALQNHYESIHSEGINNLASDGRGMFNCSACKMKLGSEIELQSHYARHHSDRKEELEVETMLLQVKALEESKALLQGELQAMRTQSSELLKENVKIREERDGFELKAAKLAADLADHMAKMDELKTQNLSLESTLKVSEERITRLEIETQQRPAADDVAVLQQEMVSLQTMMDNITLQREAEKEALQKQCNSLQETCLKLQAEKTELETVMKSCPKKEEMFSLQEKISEMSKAISQLQRDLDVKENEKNKLQFALEKFKNYEEIKASLAEKENSIEEVLRASAEKDSVILKLQNDLKSERANVEEMKAGRDALFSKIEEREGANAAILQLKEENARFQEQLLHQQNLLGNTINDSESKMEELRSSLKRVNSDYQLYNAKCSELEGDLAEAQKNLKHLQSQKDTLTEELNLKIANLTATEAADKARLRKLEEELDSKRKSLEEKTLALESLQKIQKEEKTSHMKDIEKIHLEKKNLEKRLTDLANTLPLVQADLMNKEKKLSDTETKLQHCIDQLESLKKDKHKIEEELKDLQKENEEMKLKLEESKDMLKESEAVKVQFGDKISSLSEELLKFEMQISEMNVVVDSMNDEKSQLNDKYTSLEEENKNLRFSVTSLQNEKNSLLSELEKVKKELSDVTEICAVQEKGMKDLSELFQKEKSNAEKVLKDFQLAKEIYLKDKLKMQKQIENLENDCAKQVSQIQENVKTLENQLEEAEEKSAAANSSLAETKDLLKQKEVDWEKNEAHHEAQIGVLTENIKTLRDDLSSEQKRRENVEQKLDEISGLKLELEAKLENALDERRGLLERCLRSETKCEELQKSTGEMRRKYEDCVAALQELGRENQTLQVENMKHITRKWADDSEVTHCTACGKLFTVTIRKHHCRNCGSIFCNECSAKTATVASSKKPVRVCDVCYNEVTK